MHKRCASHGTSVNCPQGIPCPGWLLGADAPNEVAPVEFAPVEVAPVEVPEGDKP